MTDADEAVSDLTHAARGMVSSIRLSITTLQLSALGDDAAELLACAAGDATRLAFLVDAIAPLLTSATDVHVVELVPAVHRAAQRAVTRGARVRVRSGEECLVAVPSRFEGALGALLQMVAGPERSAIVSWSTESASAVVQVDVDQPIDPTERRLLAHLLRGIGAHAVPKDDALVFRLPIAEPE